MAIKVGSYYLKKDFVYLKQMMYNTCDLEQAFGTPIIFPHDKSEYYWGIKINDAIYNIYDWYTTPEMSNERQWFLCSNKQGQDSKYIKQLEDLIIECNHDFELSEISLTFD